MGSVVVSCVTLNMLPLTALIDKPMALILNTIEKQSTKIKVTVYLGKSTVFDTLQKTVLIDDHIFDNAQYTAFISVSFIDHKERGKRLCCLKYGSTNTYDWKTNGFNSSNHPVAILKYQTNNLFGKTYR